jgi:hypothetical protein
MVEEVMLVLIVKSVLVGMLVPIVILVLVVKSMSLRCSSRSNNNNNNNNNYKNNNSKQYQLEKLHLYQHKSARNLLSARYLSSLEEFLLQACLYVQRPVHYYSYSKWNLMCHTSKQLFVLMHLSGLRS